MTTPRILAGRAAQVVVGLWSRGLVPLWLIHLFGFDIYFRTVECQRILRAIERGRVWSLPALGAYLGLKMSREDEEELERELGRRAE